MRYLHYVENPQASAKLSGLWAPDAEDAPVVDISTRRAA
jgi:hypothetical protein